MSRSPLAYPLTRSADTDVGGAADLQTDVMRFMAILALCLVAIFALVQSIPLTPAEPLPEPEVAGGPSGPTESRPKPPRPAPHVSVTPVERQQQQQARRWTTHSRLTLDFDDWPDSIS